MRTNRINLKLKNDTNENSQKAWTIPALHRQMQIDLVDRCHTDFERANLKAIYGKEIRDLADAQSKIRDLTSQELSIARIYGFR